MRNWLRRRSMSPAARAYEGATHPSATTPWRDAHYAVVDLETTGLDPRNDEIVSFSAVPIDDGRVIAGATRTLTVRPEQMPGWETVRIHGLRPVDLGDAPTLPEVLDLVFEALTSRVLVAHVAWVEVGFLSAALRLGGARLREPVLDTEALARQALGDGEPVSDRTLPLSDTARKLGLPVHSPHSAEGDALTTAQVFLAIATRLDRAQPQTVGSLARASKGSS